MIITDESVPSRNKDVIERLEEEDLLLFHSAIGKLFEVNRVGKEIWKMCDGTLKVRQIKEELANNFSPSKRIEDDTEEFLDKLFHLNLIHLT